MKVQQSDILWSRNGDPQLVKEKSAPGYVLLEGDFDKIQDMTKVGGLKNGLDPVQKQEVRTVLEAAADEDQKASIRKLFEQLKKLKEGKADPRVVRYVENELHFQMMKARYHPEGFSADAANYII